MTKAKPCFLANKLQPNYDVGTYIQLDDPEEGDEEEVESDEEAEGAADIGDGLPLCRRGGQVVRRGKGERGLGVGRI